MQVMAKGVTAVTRVLAASAVFIGPTLSGSPPTRRTAGAGASAIQRGAGRCAAGPGTDRPAEADPRVPGPTSRTTVAQKRLLLGSPSCAHAGVLLGVAHRAPPQPLLQPAAQALATYMARLKKID